MKSLKKIKSISLMACIVMIILGNHLYAEEGLSDNSKKADKPGLEKSSEDNMERKNALLFMPFAMQNGVFYVEYQRALDSRSGLIFGAQYVNVNFKNDVSLVGIWALYRFKVFKNNYGPLDGFGVAAGIELDTPIDIDKFLVGIVLHAYLQYQFVLPYGVAIEFFAGPQYFILPELGTKYDQYNGMLSPSIGVEVGYAF